MKTVIENVVNYGFCCGCGVCAGICPNHVLSMEWNKYGEYNPIAEHECSYDCGLCLNVCPFAKNSITEDKIGTKLYGSISGIHHRSETGYYLNVSTGAVTSEGHRFRSASGGMATWFLNQLIQQDVVDAVICVQHSNREDRLFKFVIADNTADIMESAGSVYYPVEISEMIHLILKHKKRYAIIGLPCLIKGVRLAQDKNKRLRERIVVTIGLACSNMKSIHFTKYAAYQSGLKEDLSKVSYRSKSLQMPPKFYQFRFTGSKGTKTVLEWDRKTWHMFHEGFCSLHACDVCDDMFAECADICFMDAWIPECSNEPRGTSIWISRSECADSILRRGLSEGEIIGRDVPVQHMLDGQGRVIWKQDLLSYRLILLERQGETPPIKRIPKKISTSSYLDKERCKFALKIQRDSREICSEGDYAKASVWFDEIWKSRPWMVKIVTSTLPPIMYLKTKLMLSICGRR